MESMIWAMGLLLAIWLLRRYLTVNALKPPTRTHHWNDVPVGIYPVDAVGESHYQKNLRRAVGGEYSKDGAYVEKSATLRPYKSPHDANAVQVLIDNLPVGHLSRQDAPRFRQRLVAAGLGTAATSCPALIVGGGVSSKDGYQFSFGVKLGLSPLFTQYDGSSQVIGIDGRSTMKIVEGADGRWHVGDADFATEAEARAYAAGQASKAAPPTPPPPLPPQVVAGKSKPQTKKLHLALAALLLFIIAKCTLNQQNSGPGTQQQAVAALTPEQQAERDKANPEKQWQYITTKDDLTGKEIILARLVSPESLRLEFPYQGENRIRLTVRQHPQYKEDVFLSVDKGQILCNLRDCDVQIRFDDNPPEKYQGSEPSDRSSETIFLNAESRKRFLRKAAGAKKIVVQLGFFNQGVHTRTFETISPLVWPHQQK